MAAAGQLIETTKARLHLMESKKTDRDTTVRLVLQGMSQGYDVGLISLLLGLKLIIRGGAIVTLGL